MDLPNIGDFLANGVNAAFKATEASDKFLPVKGFKDHSLQSAQQNEILSTVALILPVIWKFIENKDGPAAAEDFKKLLGSDILFPIADFFIFNNPSASERFSQYDRQLGDYLAALKLFSEKDFVGALKARETAMKNAKPEGLMNSVLLSWIYYKLGRLEEARECVLYSQFRTLAPYRRDFTYKRDLLFGGNMMHFYYLPLQAYYNEFILFALIKMHNGDHSMALREIFGYLNAVVYNN